MRPIIKVENISKQYRLGTIGAGTMREDVQRWWYHVRGKEDPFLKISETNDRSVKGNSEYVWALRDLNFEVMPGEVLGIIGKNGAGKSTLLKILSKVTGPTTGRVDFNGRIASLLEVGTGFHSDLTGRENIFLNGAILGMNKREIRSKLDEIIDFSGCERYIDTPVKRYSSGMTVRLGFAVAAHLEPEILVVDEVLAVGDAEFQKKAIGKMQDVSRNQGRTVLFVSHNMGVVKNLCKKGLIISAGQLISEGPISEILVNYLEDQQNIKSVEWQNKAIQLNPINFKRIKILALRGQQPALKIDIEIELQSLTRHKSCFFAFDVTDELNVPIFQTIPDDKVEYHQEQKRIITIELPPLIPGNYFISAWIGPHNTETYDWVKSVVSFEVAELPKRNWSFPFSNDHGYIVVNSYTNK